jgi:hypothetical protein
MRVHRFSKCSTYLSSKVDFLKFKIGKRKARDGISTINMYFAIKKIKQGNKIIKKFFWGGDEVI